MSEPDCDPTTKACSEGDLTNPNTGAACPTGASNAFSTKCPKYGAGIAPITNFNTDVALVIGPFSRSATCDHFDIGDDYTFSNNSFMAIDHLRWIGGGGARLVWEMRDASGNLIEDTVTLGVGGFGLYTLLIDPPIIVPPSGYVTVRPAPQFAPNGRTFIAATDVVDIGSNDANALWYDGAIHTGSTFIKECVGGINDGGWCDPVNTGSDCPVPGVCTARNQILAIELEGTKTNEPLGACCNLNSGTCTGNDGWICEGNGGAFLGQGSFCNSCNAGTTLGANCSRCVGGANLNLACQRASDCPGSTCAANASVCANSCTGGAANGAPCLVAGDCPGGVCTVGGNPGSVCNANTACGVGACCNPTTGNCTLVTPTACTTSGGNFQGFGTDCDSDNGHENGQQSCCPQPQKKYCNGGTNNHGVCTTNGNCPGGGTCSANRYPGGDNCEDAIVQPISVAGTTYQDPVVVTISGDNSTASGQDTCGNAIFDITTGPGADPGWWEAFQIDSCAFVRVDFCCSSPTVEPQWSFMYTGCPCNSVVANIADPNVTDESAVARGKPYCDNDDNLWLKFGPLPAGTYYMPVYSVLAGHHGPYQMHITAYACPTAACCAGGNCSVTDFLNCQNTLQGTYLGPPNLPTAVSTCDNTPVTGTCGTGSCCTAPGQCKDQIPNNGPKATEAACLGLGGNPIYHGGIRCKGGSCDNNSNISCNSESDPACGGGHCTGTATEFAQASPCPPCEIQDNAHCQTAGLPVAGARLSDYCVADCVATPSNGGLFVADDFTADVGGNLMKVCFEGIFGDQNTGLGDCSGSNPPEVFEVAIYADRGLPDETNVLGRTSTHVVAKAQIGTGYNPVVPIFRWQVSLDHPIALVQGTKYWISIINNTNKNLGGTPGCDWFWENSQQTEGNHYYVYGQDQIWTAADVLTGGDMGFCLDIANSPPIVPTKACCACSSFPNPSGSDPHCKDLTAEDCATVHGDWLFSLDTCGTHQCQAVGFAGDNCTAAIVAPVPSSNNAYSNSFNNFCANTDGPTNLTCRGANTRFGNDVWYKYTASCTGTLEVSTCDDSGEFDTVMAVYHSVGVCVGGTSAGKNCNVAGDCPGGGTCPANANVCGCPPTNNLGQFGDCNDDGCVFNGAGSKIGPINVTQGECYTIRVAGFNAAQGHGTFHADCVPSGGGPPVVQGVPNQVDKNRYLAFSVPSVQTAAAATSLKVSLISLLHPNPANLNPPPDFSSREGQHWWVELDPSTKTCSNVANHQKSCSSDNDCGGSPGTCVSTPGYCQESETPASTFRCGILQCAATTPRDWAAELGTDPIYVTGPVLVPSSTFVVTNCADPNNCPANTTLCVGGVNNGNACTTDAQCTGGACGDPKFLTQRWGDVFTSFQTKNTCHGGTNANAPCLGDSYCPGGSCKVCVNGTNNGNPCTNKCSGGANNTLPCFTDAECPGGVCAASTQCPGGACGVTLTQPNISDVSAIIDKFKSTSGAIGVAFADLVPATPDHRVNISDVAACVDAFKAIAYPFQLVSFPTCP
ncbi:MAG: hypothetical protein HYR83_10090 [Planctomycetes bacterium]|nr:hypothetical protein [Planctomycetota bacterium]